MQELSFGANRDVESMEARRSAREVESLLRGANDDSAAPEELLQDSSSIGGIFRHSTGAPEERLPSEALIRLKNPKATHPSGKVERKVLEFY